MSVDDVQIAIPEKVSLSKEAKCRLAMGLSGAASLKSFEPSSGHWFNTGDFRMSMIPTWFDQFWDYPRNPTYRILESMVRNNRLPQLMVFAGPAGGGKTASAYVLGCVTSCEHFDPVTHAPCGHCDLCAKVRLEKVNQCRGAFVEIDCGDRENSGSRPIDDVYRARTLTSSYRSSKYGDPGWNYIVFLDEAQRLTATNREALLKLTEKWPGAHVILATTDLNRLDIPGAQDGKNPLLSRATVFHFSYPTPEECVKGLNRTATQVKLELDDGVALWIANKCGCAPRECLGELYMLSNFGLRISMQTIADIYGPQVVVAGRPAGLVSANQSEDEMPVIY